MSSTIRSAGDGTAGAWQERWALAMGSSPVDRTSREVSVQEALTELIAGRHCAWFQEYPPTPAGGDLLVALSTLAFGERTARPGGSSASTSCPYPRSGGTASPSPTAAPIARPVTIDGC